MKELKEFKAGGNLQMQPRKLLVLDSSYSLEAIRTRKLEDSVTCRDLGGFFAHVWTVHPFASLVTSKNWTSTYGHAETHVLAPKHTFIEGKVGRFTWLKSLAPLNFIVGQLFIFLNLCRLIKEEKISVIRAGDPLYLGLMSWALSSWCGIPFLVRVGGNHDKIYETTGQPLQKRLFFNRRIEKIVERFVFSRADIVAGANQDNLNFALENGARSQYSTLFRYGNLIDKRHFSEPRERVGGAALLGSLEVVPGRFILYVGRFESVKHPDDVIRVLARIVERGHDIKALLAGDGQMHSVLVELAAQLGITDRVVFCGNRDQEWLAKVIPLSAAVISPHTGRALSEAALGAAAIVAYDIDWQSELIESGVTGEIVKHGDWVSMAASLERFLVDTGYARTMGSAVRIRVQRMMDPEVLDEHERKQYENLIARTAKRSCIS